MGIKISRQETTLKEQLTYGQLKVGDIFLWASSNDRSCMKLKTSMGPVYLVTGGSATDFSDDNKVVKFDGELLVSEA